MRSVILDAPNELLCVDLMGPLPQSQLGAIHLFVTIDVFLKYIYLFPLKRAITVILTPKMKICFEKSGKPKRVLVRQWCSVLIRQVEPRNGSFRSKSVFTSLIS